MAYIYKIENDINDKLYIGKTEFSIEKRFKEHCHDSTKQYLNRPLYKAMRKYGIEHFHISLIETTDNPEEREKYWIEFYGSFKNGYNATLGGDGKKYLDYDLIVKTYQECLNAKTTAKICGVNVDSVYNILESKGIPRKSGHEILRDECSKTVAMMDKQNNILEVFPSCAEASKYLIKNNKTTSTIVRGVIAHITQVCNGRRKTAYGFKWKYV